MQKSLKIALVTILSFGIYYLIDEVYFRSLRKSLFELIGHVGISHIISYTIVGIPIFSGILIMHKKATFFNNLGLDKSLLKAFLFAFICVLPMLIGFSFVFDFTPDLSVNRILIAIIAAGFFEELYFRGFLFGQLFRHTKIGFILSILIGAVIFALGHLYQSNDTQELIGIFSITLLGSVLFGWLYAEHSYNIWVPVFLHMLMNLSWELFSVNDTALGGAYANIFRTTTVILAIVLTVMHKKRKKIKLEVNKKTIWKKSS